jgi:hypothetical protein
MKQKTMFVFVLVVATAAAQSPIPVSKGAAAYAAELARLAGRYQQEVEQQAAAEAEAHQAAMQLYSTAQDRTVLRALEARRDRLAADLALALEEGALSPVEVVSRALPEYAAEDFESLRKRYEQEAVDQRSYLATLTQLRLESAKIGALRQSLRDLSTKPDAAQWTRRLREAAADLTKLDCALGAGRLAFFAAEGRRLSERIAKASGLERQRLERELAEAQSLPALTDAGCPVQGLPYVR